MAVIKEEVYFGSAILAVFFTEETKVSFPGIF